LRRVGGLTGELHERLERLPVAEREYVGRHGDLRILVIPRALPYWMDNASQCGLAYPDVTLDPSLGQAHLVFQVQDGEHRVLSPEPYAEADFRLPPWLQTALRS
jgi:hypothetical protein